MEPLDAEGQDLVVRFLPLARKLSKPYRRRFPRYADEFDSDAMLALIGAARRFDPARGVAFGHYARTRIVGALRDRHRVIASPSQNLPVADAAHVSVELRIESTFVNRESLRAVMRFLPRMQRKAIQWIDQRGFSQAEYRKWLASKGKHRVHLSATTISVYRSKARAAMKRYARLFENWILLKRVMGKLTPRQALAFRHTYLEGLTRTEAAKRMGIRHQNVTKLLRKAMVRVDAELAGLEITGGSVPEQGDSDQEG